MLYRFFKPFVLPHENVPINKEGNFKCETYVVREHAEIPRKEYSYVWNSDGLRTKELSTKPNIIVLGCSITMGSGLPENLTWAAILESKLKQHGEYSIGNISYNGASVMKVISSFFGFIDKYEYLPEYVICNFPNLERAYFPNPELTYIGDLFWYRDQVLSKDSAPFSWSKILPVEWIYYSNLDHIKMLEVFCKVNNIKLIWSTWSTNMTTDMEKFIKDNFKFYIDDTTKQDFNDSFEFNLSTRQDNVDDIKKLYKMQNWDNILCHEKEKIENEEIFDCAYDYHQNKVHWSKTLTPLQPHPGIHRHFHWAEMYYNKIKDKLK